MIPPSISRSVGVPDVMMFKTAHMVNMELTKVAFLFATYVAPFAMCTRCCQQLNWAHTDRHTGSGTPVLGWWQEPHWAKAPKPAICFPQ